MRIAVDAMGGDRAPAEIVAGALAAVEQLGVEVLLVGRAGRASGPSCPDGEPPTGSRSSTARRSSRCTTSPAISVRTKKDASVVRAAEAVRDGRADAMVGAGNTGATMASALLRFGRIRGVARPAVAVPIPVPFGRPHLLVDGGATIDCSPEWLTQFARMGRTYAQVRLGVDEPTVGLLSNGEEPGKGDELRKQTFASLVGPALVRRQRRGPRPHDRPPGRDRHRRLHRQRRDQDDRGRPEGRGRAGVHRAGLDSRGQGGGSGRRADAPPGRDGLPRSRHGRWREPSSGSTACASSRTARRRRERS